MSKNSNIKKIITILAILFSFSLPVFSESKTVRVGYFYGQPKFQNGFSDDEYKSGYAYEYYQAVARKTGFVYEYIYGSFSDIYNMLQSGQIDVAAGFQENDASDGLLFLTKHHMGILSESFEIDGFVPAEKSGENKIFFAVNKNRPDLLEDFDRAMEEINLEIPFFNEKLQEKYYVNSKPEFHLADEEKETIIQKGVIRLGCLKGLLPYCTVDENGMPAGVITVIQNHLQKLLKIPVEIISYDYPEEMKAALQADSIDAIFPEFDNLWFSEKDNELLSNAVINDYSVFVFKGEYSPELAQRMALARKSMGQNIRTNALYPIGNVQTYPTYFDCLKAVLHGQADSTYMPVNVFYRLSNETDEFDELQCLYGRTILNYSFAFSRENYQLCNIFNKVLSQVPQSEIENALVQYTEVYKKTSLLKFFLDNFWPCLLFVVLVLLIITLSYIHYLRSRVIYKNRMEEKEKEISKKNNIIKFQEQAITIDALTQVNNRYQFEKYMDVQIMDVRQNRHLGVHLYMAILDLDYFKKINDTFGHAEGDKALVIVASVMKNICNKTRVFISRYGGDEFVIVSHNREQLMDLCQGISDRVRMESRVLPYRMHISFGIAEFTEDMESKEQFISMADKELYESKKAYHRAMENKLGLF